MSFLPEFSYRWNRAAAAEALEPKVTAVTAASASAASQPASRPIPIAAAALMSIQDHDDAVVESSPAVGLRALDFTPLVHGLKSIPASLPDPNQERTRKFLQKQEAWRVNMLNEMNTSIKTLIRDAFASSVTAGPIGDDFAPLVHVIDLVNQVFQHGVKAKRFGFSKRAYWDWLAEYLPKHVPEANSSILSIREMSNLTSQQKGVAWIKMTLMEKQLATYTRILCEDKDFISQMYEVHAMLRADQSNVLLGLLLSLNTFDVYLDVRNVTGISLIDSSEADKQPWMDSFEAPSSTTLGTSAPAPSQPPLPPTASVPSASQSDTLPTPIVAESWVEGDRPTEAAATNAASDATAADTQDNPPPAEAPARSNAAPARVEAAVPRAEDLAQQKQLAFMAEQKTYHEELNRELQGKLVSVREQLNARIRFEEEQSVQLALSQEELRRTEAQRAALEIELRTTKTTSARQIQTLKEDFDTERKSLVSQKTELNSLFQKELKNVRSLEAIIEDERTARAISESRATAAEEAVKAAGLEFDAERCESNREKAALEAQIAEALRQVEEATNAKAKLTSDFARAKNTIKALKNEKKQWEDASTALNSEASQALSTASEMKTAREQVENNMRQLLSALEQERLKSASYVSRIATLEADIADKLRVVEELKRREKMLLAEVEQRRAVEQQLAEAREQIENLKKQLAEKEETMIELAAELGKTRVTVESLEEFKLNVKTSEWTEDRNATNCKNCNAAFSVTTRKHHCRNCGGIYCANCSSHRVQLPSSKNAVRVCDNCWNTILMQSST